MPTQLLNDDGTASMATLIMSSHHAFRRDVACFAAALATVAPTDARIAELAAEWTRFHAALHGHHTVEDTSMFPGMRAAHPQLASTLDELDAHHRAIDPLLERGDALFAALASSLPAARDVIGALAELLATHLELEELTITPHLRASRAFPPPPDEQALALYADGFAWSSAGIAQPVLDQIYALLPDGLRARLPAARAAFDARCERVWGRAHSGASTTSVPAHAR